jgi:lycopene cyclase domain-containing protein
MTYFAYLALFLGVPLALLSAVTIYDFRRGKWQPPALNAWRAWVVILGLCVVAFAYTTPWDNYLVATGVWWYDPELVTGFIIGYVPIEEYTFFILLPIFACLWTLLLMRYLPTNPRRADSVRARLIATGVTFVVWVLSCVLLVLTFVNADFKAWTYLALELSWALIPVMIQMAFGADILLRHWRVVALAIVSATAYLAATDAVAIAAGTWTIDPAQSLPVLIGGVLPIEELIFFFIVTTLSVFGLTLVMAEESQARAMALGKYALFRPLVRFLPQAPQSPTTADAVE